MAEYLEKEDNNAVPPVLASREGSSHRYVQWRMDSLLDTQNACVKRSQRPMPNCNGNYIRNGESCRSIACAGYIFLCCCGHKYGLFPITETCRAAVWESRLSVFVEALHPDGARGDLQTPILVNTMSPDYLIFKTTVQQRFASGN